MRRIVCDAWINVYIEPTIIHYKPYFARHYGCQMAFAALVEAKTILATVSNGEWR